MIKELGTTDRVEQWARRKHKAYLGRGTSDRHDAVSETASGRLIDVLVAAGPG